MQEEVVTEGCDLPLKGDHRVHSLIWIGSTSHAKFLDRLISVCLYSSLKKSSQNYLGPIVLHLFFFKFLSWCRPVSGRVPYK